MKPDDQADVDLTRSQAEQRTLTTEEFRQLDTMLGGKDFPTLIRPADPTPATRTAPGLIQTLVVGIILVTIVALALYLFR